MTTFLDPTDNLLFGLSAAQDPQFTDGIVPKKFWVSPSGADGDANGSPAKPFLTTTFALTKCVSGRGDTIYVGPGSYAESVSVNKANVAIIGTGGRHTGITQIIGSPTASSSGNGGTATVYVGSGFAAGFRLANVELDTNGVSVPALRIDTNDTGATPAASSAYYRFLVENVDVRSNDPVNGFQFAGATLGLVRKCTINGPQIGIAFTGVQGGANQPSDLQFEDIDFYNGMSNTVAADLAVVNSPISPATINAAGISSLTNIIFKRTGFYNRNIGAGGSTNYINFPSTITVLNVGFHGTYFASQPTNGSRIATMPTGMVVIGQGSTGLVNLVG